MNTLNKQHMNNSLTELENTELRQVAAGSHRTNNENIIFGGTGNDVLLGDRGNDRVEQLDVNGQGGSDVIIGSVGLNG